MEDKKATSRRLAVLGSTGSIGRQTLDVVRALPGKFTVTALAARNNLSLLQRQIADFHPLLVHYQNHEKTLTSDDFQMASLEEIACHPDVDTVMVGTSGKAGLRPTLVAISAGKKIALSNKEPLVMAGEIVMAAVHKTRNFLLPVDSEHSAIWQCLQGETARPKRLILTASGGPFRRYSPDELEKVTAAQALQHPSWHMGPKVTVDSATLMNKGLEVIEAHWLFDMPFDQIDVVVHPQSFVHSMVELADGTVKAQMSSPDMRFPIQYALSYPERWPNSTLPALDWQGVRQLAFEPPDYSAFPCLKLAIEAGRRGGTYPAALCGADEAAVDLFLRGHITFPRICGVVESVLSRHQSVQQPSLDEILEAETWARREAFEIGRGATNCRSS